MSAGYLLDSNVLSEPLRPQPHPRVLESLRRYDGRLATASPVWHELLFGLHRLSASRRREAIARYLDEVIRPYVPVLPYAADAADWHARERARLTARGTPPAFVDGQIAAVAAVNGLVLVTRNTSHFQSFQGIEIEDWAV